MLRFMQQEQAQAQILQQMQLSASLQAQNTVPNAYPQSRTAPAPGPERGRLSTPLVVPTTGMQPPFGKLEKAQVKSIISEVMAPPSLRPESPPPLPSSAPIFNLGSDRNNRTAVQASSYWSVAEAIDFPSLLRLFGTDWAKIADHMQSKTAIMVKNYYARQEDSIQPDWEKIANKADNMNHHR